MTAAADDRAEPVSFHSESTSEADSPRRVAVLGIGLLGGSVALAVRRSWPHVELVGYARSPATREKAVALGVVDQAVEFVAAASDGCDVIVVATPVNSIADLVIEAAQASPDECLITDVGSTKATIVAAVSQQPVARGKFVAAHPIAGGEKAGVEHATADLFDDRVVVLTPGDFNNARQVARAHEFWRRTGANVCVLSAAEHDAHLAATSHVPHLVSAGLARLLDTRARELVGTGWLDTTRIAAGDAGLWTAIVAENQPAIVRELDRVVNCLSELRDAIAAADQAAVQAWLTEAQRIRLDFEH